VPTGPAEPARAPDSPPPPSPRKVAAGRLTGSRDADRRVSGPGSRMPALSLSPAPPGPCRAPPPWCPAAPPPWPRPALPRGRGAVARRSGGGSAAPRDRCWRKRRWCPAWRSRWCRWAPRASGPDRRVTHAATRAFRTGCAQEAVRGTRLTGADGARARQPRPRGSGRTRRLLPSARSRCGHRPAAPWCGGRACRLCAASPWACDACRAWRTGRRRGGATRWRRGLVFAGTDRVRATMRDTAESPACVPVGWRPRPRRPRGGRPPARRAFAL
jgi:hypothetical protein